MTAGGLVRARGVAAFSSRSFSPRSRRIRRNRRPPERQDWHAFPRRDGGRFGWRHAEGWPAAEMGSVSTRPCLPAGAGPDAPSVVVCGARSSGAAVLSRGATAAGPLLASRCALLPLRCWPFSLAASRRNVSAPSASASHPCSGASTRFFVSGPGGLDCRTARCWLSRRTYCASTGGAAAQAFADDVVLSSVAGKLSGAFISSCAPIGAHLAPVHS